jgi:uracil-DNA glycosylase
LKTINSLVKNILQCKVCEKHLPFPPRPIIQVSSNAQIIIIGQAPGIKAHSSNQPWNDASGIRLRDWLGISSEVFYNANKIAIIPMGFCYPGKAKSGDLGPRKECAPMWHEQLIQVMPLSITFLIGQHAQDYYLNDKLSVTERVKNWQRYQPDYFVLPHPSPRNNIWLKKNPWFEQDIIPIIQKRTQKWISPI